jgi:hypothetical protein
MHMTEQRLCLSFILNFFAANFFSALSGHGGDSGQMAREYSRALQKAASSVWYSTSWTT